MPRSKPTSENSRTPSQSNDSNHTREASTPESTLTSRLHELISACFTGLWVQTAEPQEAIHELTTLCHQFVTRSRSW